MPDHFQQPDTNITLPVLKTTKGIRDTSRYYSPAFALRFRQVRTCGRGVEVKESTLPGAGKGLFCEGSPIDQNALITLYEGVVVPTDDAKRVLQAAGGCGASHWCGLKAGLTVAGITEPIEGLGAASFANHRSGRQCNAKFTTLEVGEIFCQVALQALRVIAPGEEVFVSYGRTYWAAGLEDPLPPQVVVRYDFTAMDPAEAARDPIVQQFREISTRRSEDAARLRWLPSDMEEEGEEEDGRGEGGGEGEQQGLKVFCPSAEGSLEAEFPDDHLTMADMKLLSRCAAVEAAEDLPQYIHCLPYLLEGMAFNAAGLVLAVGELHRLPGKPKRGRPSKKHKAEQAAALEAAARPPHEDDEVEWQVFLCDETAFLGRGAATARFLLVRVEGRRGALQRQLWEGQLLQLECLRLEVYDPGHRLAVAALVPGQSSWQPLPAGPRKQGMLCVLRQVDSYSAAEGPSKRGLMEGLQQRLDKLEAFLYDAPPCRSGPVARHLKALMAELLPPLNTPPAAGSS